MSITIIIGLIISAVSAILGAFAMHPIAKASGRKEGAEQASQQQQITQAQATVKAVQERANVESKVAAATDDDLDQRLSKHSRPD